MSVCPRIATLVAALTLSALPSAQLPPSQRPGEIPRFRGGVELVQLDVSVLDRDRRPVAGLTASDFTVLEDGRERPIRAFTPIRLPPRAARPDTTGNTAVASDVATNHVANQDGRLVFILMDRTIPVGQPTIAARRIATAAVETLGPGDLAAVITTSGGVPQTLTADRDRLVAAINGGDWSTGVSKEQDDILERQLLIGRDDPLSDGRCLCGLCVLDTVTRIADAVQDVPRRRKLLLFIGSSLILQVGPRDPQLDVGCPRRVEDSRQRMFESLAGSNLTVHSLDPIGLASIGAHTRAGSPGASWPIADGPLARRQRLQADTSDLLRGQGSLQVLPDLTGGRTVLNTNEPEQAIPAIFEETDSYYVLAFEPATPTAPQDRKRKVEVRVRGERLRVHAQRQYALRRIAAASSSAAEPTNVAGPAVLQEALQGALPDPGRPLAMALAAFAGSGSPKALVIVTVDVAAFAVPDGSPVPLDVAVSALDRFGRRVIAARQRSTISFQRWTTNSTVEANVQTHLELEPGDYEIRLGVSDPARNLTASVYSEIGIPKFGSAPLSLSDVTFESAARSTAVATSPPAPTTRRAFRRDDRVRAVLQVYQGTQRTDPELPVSVRVRIVDASGRAVRDQLIQLTEREFTDRRASVAADLDGLHSGDFLLTFDASMATEKDGRGVRFTVQ